MSHRPYDGRHLLRTVTGLDFGLRVGMIRTGRRLAIRIVQMLTKMDLRLRS